MAQWNKTTQDYLNQERSLFEVYMSADRYGNTEFSNAHNPGGTGVFGENLSESITPVLQLDGLYGIGDDNLFQLNSAGSGGQSVDSNGLMTVNSGTGAGNFATLRSKRSIRYRPGQGSMCRFTAMWPVGFTTGYQQVAGFINQSDVLSVGYNYGDVGVAATTRKEFAILRRSYGKGEVFQLNVTTAATQTGIATITLDGTAHEVTLYDASSNTGVTAAGIGTNTFPGWVVDYAGSKVNFLYNGPPSNRTGVFSVVNNAGAVIGVSTLQDGAAASDEWVYQSSFNVDKLDGTGASGMTIDTTKLNVFQIDFRWLGSGVTRFAIEDPDSGNMFTFHEINYSNRNTRSHLSNPSMRVGYAAVNAAPALGTGTDVTVKGGSMMGAIQGDIVSNVTSKSASNAYDSNLAADIDHHLLTVKNDRINEAGTNNVLNQREVLFKSLAAGVVATGSNIATIKVYKNADLSDGSNDVNFVYSKTENQTSSSTTTARHKSGTGTLIATFTVTSNSTTNIDLEPYRMILAPTERLSVFFNCTAVLSTSVCGLTYIEE